MITSKTCLLVLLLGLWKNDGGYDRGSGVLMVDAFGSRLQISSKSCVMNNLAAAPTTKTLCANESVGHPSHHRNKNGPTTPNKRLPSFTSGVATTMLTLAVMQAPIILPAHADTVELSRGAIIVQTSNVESSFSNHDSWMKSSIDSKNLLKTLFQNRKELSSSVGRIQTVIGQELAQVPAWKELQKELLSVEGDLAGMIRVLPPSDIRETIKDVSAGKLNLVVNGEIINIQVLPTFGDQEDDLVIAIKGFKGNDVFRFPTPGDEDSAQPRYGPIRSYFSQYEPFWNWWATPFEVRTRYAVQKLECNRSVG